MLNKSNSAFTLRFKLKTDRIDAVALAGGRRTIVEDVPEMRSAAGADDFRAIHAIRGVFFERDRARECLIERRPTGTGIKFRVRYEECVAAGDAFEHALAFLFQEFPGKKRLCPLLAQDGVLLQGEFLLQFLFGGHVTHWFDNNILRSAMRTMRP